MRPTIRINHSIAWGISLLLLFSVVYPALADGPGLFTGFRGSKIWNYTPGYWAYVADSMSHDFTSPGIPAAIWIVTFYGSNGDIFATFPSGGNLLPHVSFPSIDYNETYLTEFDRRGIRVWLQIEPGAASVASLIDAVLSRYNHHPCVTGFGIDVEWLDTQSYSGGRRPTDVEASEWETRVASYDSAYSLFLKHYTQNRMPPTYRGHIIFIDDSQQFSSLSSCVSEFRAWGNSFAPNRVGFQLGYAADRAWWSNLTNPPATIGNALLANIINIAGLFWVDFTVTEVFPPSALAAPEEETLPALAALDQNYPNPFNPTTVVRFEIPAFRGQGSGISDVKLAVYDLLGREVAVLVNERKAPGSYELKFNAAGLASGVYFYRLEAGSSVQVRTMLLLK